MKRCCLKKLCLGLTILLFLTVYAQAQNDLVAPIKVRRTVTSITFDGKCNDQAWRTAEEYNEFVQGKPVPGGITHSRTSFRLLYDDQYFYVGVTAYDSTGKYFISNLQRDKFYNNEDAIGVMIDSYNDKFHSLIFYANLAGSRFDAEITENGSDMNPDYNTFWDVKTAVVNDGYEMEFRIPFSSLRFKQQEVVTMGFKIFRQMPRSNEAVVYPKFPANLNNVINRVNSEAEIIFSDLKAITPIYIIPYVKGNFTQVQTLDAASNSYKPQQDYLVRNYFSKKEVLDKLISNMGVDAKIGLSKNFTLDVTANTDFAQAEADNRIINFTRFNVNLPEKRQFFLEANDYLNFLMPGGFSLFNSRNIGIGNGFIIPILGGARITGKQHGWQLGMLNMQTQGLKNAQVPAENFGVFHLRKDLYGNGSYCSAFFANRMTTNTKDLSNQTVAFDYFHRLDNKWSIAANVCASKDLEQKKLLDKNTLLNVAVFREVSFGYSNFITYLKSGEQFNPASGFYVDRAFDMAYMAHSFTKQIKNRKKLNWWDISLQAMMKWRNWGNYHLESSFYTLVPSLNFKNGMNLQAKITPYSHDNPMYDWQISNDIIIPAQLYAMYGNELVFESPKNIRLPFVLGVTTDKFYNGNRVSTSLSVNGSINKHLAWQGVYQYNHIQFPHSYSLQGNAVYVSHLLSMRLNYAWNSKLSCNYLLQYDNGSKTFGSNFRIRYNPKEGTDLYIVYNPNLNTALQRVSPELPRVAQQAFIAKFSKTFSMKSRV